MNSQVFGRILYKFIAQSSIARRILGHYVLVSVLVGDVRVSDITRRGRISAFSSL